MHKKSLEASKKLNEVEMSENIKDELRSESIAALRAKAHDHTSKIVGSSTDDPPINTGNTTNNGGAIAVGSGYELVQCGTGRVLQET